MIKYLLFLPLCVFSVLGGEMILPPSLQVGDMIGVAAPASPPREEARQIAEGIAHLTKLGYRVKFASNLKSHSGYLAGNDYDRIKGLMDLWADPEVKAIWCYRGGFGSMRILDRVDYQFIRDHPKIFIGMSDVTALHAAIFKKTGLVTFWGPNLGQTFVRSTTTQKEYNMTQLVDRIGHGKLSPYTIPKNFPQYGHQIRTLRPGVAKGPLVGGTLSIVVSLIGTPYEIDTKGCILVLEEVDEEPYRIDRMLAQLKMSGHLNGLAGVILASWKGCLGRDKKNTLSLNEVFDHYFGAASYPVLLGFPVGHLPEQTTLPLNILAELNATEKKLRLLERPVL